MCSNVNLEIDRYNYKFSTTYGTYNNDKAINFNKLREDTGFITFDPGLKNTGITKSSISFIDGRKGILLYRGYPIEQVIDKCSFLETSYLILNGELPDSIDIDNFSKKIKKFNFLDEEILSISNKIPKECHPMGILSSLINLLTIFNIKNEDKYLYLLAKMPILASLAYRIKRNLTPPCTDQKSYYTSNLLKMLFSEKNREHKPNYIIIDALDKLLILHADHEQNCSTTTVRLLGSSHTNLYSSVSAGINALWGKRHGGANQEVIEMLENILKSGGNLKKWINKAKNKKDPFRLMGFGHRIYKNFDPRAQIAKKIAEDLIKKLNISDPILDLAKNLEKYALSDSYFKEKKLYPNIDFYSGIVYQAIGIPKNMFTVMFALGRLPGWMAHWKEIRNNNDPIGRPRQIYIGNKKRNIIKCG